MGSKEIGSIPYNVEDMPICSGSMIFKPPSEVDPFYSGGWDANVIGNAALVHQNELANPHYPVVSEKQTVGNSSHFVPFTAGLLLVDKVRKIPCFGSETFSRMASHENCQNSEDGALGSLSNAKRKRENAEVEQQNDQNVDTFEFPKQDERKNIGPNSRGKQATKQMKANSNGAEPSKENYILVRAKRGQATSSHSLAERLRREKISERMKLLQELVPGCNKITGKAMMLDEIINYVQSLQQQVEVLSMKLATVNPELNVDIDHLLMKDLLHPHPGLDPGLGSSLAFTGLHNGTINGYRGMAPPSHPLPRNLWNNELQGILQTPLDSNPSQASLGANGNLLEPTNRVDD